jgi:hypothetical protein
VTAEVIVAMATSGHFIAANESLIVSGGNTAVLSVRLTLMQHRWQCAAEL